MDIDVELLFGVVLVFGTLAGCSAIDGGGEITPVNETMSIDVVVTETGDADYVPENDTVELKMTSSGDRKEIPFEEYACHQARSRAGEAVQTVIYERLDVDPSNVKTVVGTGVGVVYYSELSVSATTLEKVTPKRVAVSVRVFGKEDQCSVPVAITESDSRPEPLV